MTGAASDKRALPFGAQAARLSGNVTELKARSTKKLDSRNAVQHSLRKGGINEIKWLGCNLKPTVEKYLPLDLHMRALVIEDERRLAENIARGLRQSGGFAVDVALDGEEGLFRSQEYVYDVVVLDLMLPRLSGEELLDTLRARGSEIPVLVLTAKEGKANIIAALNAGADDYLAKPFDMGELVARAKAVIRRNNGYAQSRLAVDTLELDIATRSVRRAGQIIELTPMEYRVIEYLILRAGSVVSKTELLEHLYDYNWEKFSNVIEVYMSGLRRKIDRRDHLKLLHTVRGHGYLLDTREAP